MTYTQNSQNKIHFYTENTLCKLLRKLKIKWLQKIKITSLVKLTVVTAKESTSVNLNGF